MLAWWIGSSWGLGGSEPLVIQSRRGLSVFGATVGAGEDEPAVACLGVVPLRPTRSYACKTRSARSHIVSRHCRPATTADERDCASARFLIAF